VPGKKSFTLGRVADASSPSYSGSLAVQRQPILKKKKSGKKKKKKQQAKQKKLKKIYGQSFSENVVKTNNFNKFLFLFSFLRHVFSAHSLSGLFISCLT
jgi:hypothetical protein